MVPEYWRNGRLDGARKEPLQVLVAFGRNDILLADFEDVLVRGISDEVRKIPTGVWIEGASHYLMEEKPEVVE